MTALILTSGRQLSIDDVRDYILELEETVTQLKHDLGLSRSSEVLSRLVARWKLTRREADVVQFLYARGGMLASKEQILHALYGQQDDEPEIKIIDVFICKVRAKLGGDTIVTEWGRGYRLSAEGLKMVEEVMAQPLPEISRAGLPVAKPRCGTLSTRTLKVFAEQGELTINEVAAKLEDVSHHRVGGLISRLRKEDRLTISDWCIGRDGRKRTIYAITDVGRAYLRKFAAQL